jgi:putative transposase
MKRIRFSEEQIIAVLREHEAGAKTADLARKHGISEATVYNWKARYGGLEVSEAKRLRALESKNARLKKLLAEAHLDNAALKDLLTKMYDLPRPGKGRVRSDEGLDRARLLEQRPVGRGDELHTSGILFWNRVRVLDPVRSPKPNRR